MKAPAFWTRPPGLLAALLSPLSALYAAAGWARRARAAPLRLGAPVICVGNISAGGTGKTPVALSLLKLLTEAGLNPHALSRGYGGSLKGPLRIDPDRHGAAEVGDEPLLLARAAPAWVARDRAAGALAALAAGAGCVVMDDGHQNPALHKDLSLVTVDGAVGFGNRRVMPAGPLRESVSTGLARADAVVVVGEDRHGAAAEAAALGLPVLTARLSPEPSAAAALRGKRVLAFAGIGRPEKFFATLAEIGADVAQTRSFPDHHPFTAAEIGDLRAQSAALSAQLVATAKDWARLSPNLRDGVAVLPVNLVWNDEAALRDLLRRLEKR